MINDVDALFARGWARSLKCAYMAMVERGFSSGFRLATKAKDDETRVLQLDPDYVDAKLVVGVYEYVVGALPWPFKLVIGFAGVTGSKSRGLEMLYDDGNRGVITSVEARTVIALFLRREGKYKEAIEVIRKLKSQYPHNYLFCLEEANLRKDAGEGMEAVDAYRAILADAAKPNYFCAAATRIDVFWTWRRAERAAPLCRSSAGLRAGCAGSERWNGTEDSVISRGRRVPGPERRAPAGSEGL